MKKICCLLFILTGIFGMPTQTGFGEESGMTDLNFNPLTSEEEEVMIHKGTEAPFSGKYTDFSLKGSYHCRRCNALLYRSSDKFSSSCGWPSFDDEVKGAVKRERDADGKRIEILCARCGGHLGHVFEGEGFTPKNVRHCVNSLSLAFVPETVPAQTQQAYFAGGCFWGVEYFFEHKDGVLSAVSGYMGGSKESPSYRDVCRGNTGHLEVVEITYYPEKVSYEALVKWFFEIHDPTQTNGQGPDLGEQYLSAVFYNTEEEKKTVQKLIEILKKKGFSVATRLIQGGKFWKAEEYHQDYYELKKTRPYCHRQVKRFDEE